MNIIYEDTRQQTNRHRNIETWCEKHNIKIMRTKLYVGDYTLPKDQSICIDTKYGLQEVYGNLIGKEHERFKREAQAASETGIKLIVLVDENEIHSLDEVQFWKNPRIARYERLCESKRKGYLKNTPLPSKPPVSSLQLMKTMKTMQGRYGIDWMFCRKDQTAGLICELLGIEYWR